MPKGETVIIKLKTNMEQGKDVVFTPITSPIHRDLHLHEVVVKVLKSGMIKVPISNMNIKTQENSQTILKGDTNPGKRPISSATHSNRRKRPIGTLLKETTTDS